MQIDKNIFRAYDIRGIYGKDLNDEIMKKIGMAVGTMMLRRKMGNRIVIGCDTRASSESLLNAFIEGITSMGISVLSVGATSFGVALFSGWKLKAGVTSFVTASHKPPEWNGIKFYDQDSVGFFEKDNQEIGRICIEEDFEEPPAKKGTISKKSMNEEYIWYLNGKFKINRKMKVVLDCGNGCTARVVPDLLRSFKALEVREIFCNIDPAFPGRGSDVEDENLGKLKEEVLKGGHDIGVAFDGDGDRVGFVDDKGDIPTTEQVGLVLGKKIISKGAKMIVNVESSMMLDEGVKALGGEVIRVPVGHTFMMRGVFDNNAVLGIEAAKHLVIPKYFPFDDGVVAVLKLLEILSESDRNLSEYFAEIKSYPRERVKFECSDDTKFQVIESLKKKLSKKYSRITTLDGIRVDFDDSWILARASNTGPTIRLTVEAGGKKRLDELKEQFSKIVDEEIKLCRQ